jgi:2-polyprenyl-3-methyl-5-hydroxy-6-metoxy-1,4-benzoquinol methylase
MFIICPSRLNFLRKYFKKINYSNKLKVLDVGCGSRSSHLTRRWLNVETYHGIDKTKWNDDNFSYECIDRLFELDLESQSLDLIPNNYYDVVIVSHVIEHLYNGVQVLDSLISKLTKNGIIYVESPSYRTLNYGSAIGFLNFYDDLTHKKIYFDSEIVSLFQSNGLRVIKSGFRNDWMRIIIFSVPAIILNLIYWIPIRRRLCSWGLWDLLGVCRVWVAVK